MSAEWQSTGNDTLRDLKAGEYSITVTDYNQCEVSITFQVNELSIFIPNVFTPNSDNVNDFFEVYGNTEGFFQVQIFSRWGELVFESNDRHFKWDGVYKGNIVQSVYVYLIKANGRTYTGSVTLLL